MSGEGLVDKILATPPLGRLAVVTRAVEGMPPAVAIDLLERLVVTMANGAHAAFLAGGQLDPEKFSAAYREIATSIAVDFEFASIVYADDAEEA